MHAADVTRIVRDLSLHGRALVDRSIRLSMDGPVAGR
ncbi:hypothetical protein P3T18_007225 [Paraburkholderia sp. GAS199]